MAAPKYLKDAQTIAELDIVLQNIAHDDKKALTEYTAAEIVHEAKYVLSCYQEGGHCLHDELAGVEDKDLQKEAKKEVTKLQRFIKKYDTDKKES